MHAERQNMIDEMRLRGYSATSIEHYTKWVDRLGRFHASPPGQLTRDQVGAFLLHLQERGRRPATCKHALHAFRFFFQWQGMDSVVAGWRTPKPILRIPVVPDAQEIERLLAAIPVLSLRTFFHLLYDTGMRMGEGLALRVEDLDFERRQVMVRAGKAPRERYTLLGNRSIALLRAHLAQGQASRDRVFPFAQWKSLRTRRRSLQHAFRRAVVRSGVRSEIHVHSLRHAFATHLIEANTNPYCIMRFLGHASMGPTLRYLATARLDRVGITSPADRLGEHGSSGWRPDPLQLTLPSGAAV